MRCPTCKKTIEWKDNPTRPFCSERCKLLDFGAWANEEYKVPAEEAPLSSETDQNTSSLNENTEN